MKKLALLISVLLALHSVAFPQQKKNVQRAPHLIHKRIHLKTHPYVPKDTSENALVDRVMQMMDKSQSVFEGRLISKTSHWRHVKSKFFTGGGDSEIYTVYTFKVIQWIKGSMRGNEVSFWNWGGRIGKAEEYVFPSAHYALNFTGILFVGNRKPNTQWIDDGFIQILFRNALRTGDVFVGTHVVNPEYLVNVLKQTVSDSTAYRRFIHRLKSDEIHDPSLPPHYYHKYIWTGHRWIRSDEDTSKGDVK